MRAILHEMKEDSGTLGTGPIGVEGILEIYESERSHPGRVCAQFTYPIPGEITSDTIEVPGQIWTSFSYVLEEEGSTVTLSQGGKSGQNCFIFERIE